MANLIILDVDVEDGKGKIPVAVEFMDSLRLAKFFRDYKAMIKSIPQVDDKTDCPICNGVDPNCWYCC